MVTEKKKTPVYIYISAHQAILSLDPTGGVKGAEQPVLQLQI
jgi:homospermidine synthase